LGPLLFNIYINDLNFQVTNTSLMLYADDTTEYASDVSPPVWVPANLMLGGNPAMDWHPIQGGVEILSVFRLYLFTYIINMASAKLSTDQCMKNTRNDYRSSIISL